MTTPAEAGLDIHQLRRLRRPSRNEGHLLERVREHLHRYDGYLAFSGGKDSLVTLDLARRAGEADVPVVFFDSGLEFPETYSYLNHLVDTLNVNLTVISPRISALHLLYTSGLWNHRTAAAKDNADLHDTLITEPANQAHQLYGDGQLWGLRSSESRGRAAAYSRTLAQEVRHSCHGCCTTTTEQRRQHGGMIRRNDQTVAYSPIWDWSDTEVWTYIDRRQLPTNPVYEKLRALGAPTERLRVSHLLDGSHLEHGRLTWLQRGWPGLYNELAGILPRMREYT